MYKFAVYGELFLKKGYREGNPPCKELFSEIQTDDQSLISFGICRVKVIE